MDDRSCCSSFLEVCYAALSLLQFLKCSTPQFIQSCFMFTLSSDTCGTSPIMKIFFTPDSRNVFDNAPFIFGIGSSMSNTELQIFKKPPLPSIPILIKTEFGAFINLFYQTLLINPGRSEHTTVGNSMFLMIFVSFSSRQYISLLNSKKVSR